MDQQPTINSAPNPKQNKLQGLALLKVGLFEIVFVAIALLLIFGTLNYFNILSISTVFPQLSWLPHQNKILYTPAKPAITPSPTPSTIGILLEKTTIKKNTETALFKMLGENLKESFLPSSPSVLTFYAISTEKNSFITGWTTPSYDYKIYLEFGLSPTQEISYSYINIATPYIENVSSDYSRKISSNFLPAGLKEQWTCKPFDNQVSGCENFWQENTVKKGVVVYGPIVEPVSNEKTNIIVICELKPQNKYYTSNSCFRPSR